MATRFVCDRCGKVGSTPRSGRYIKRRFGVINMWVSARDYELCEECFKKVDAVLKGAKVVEND